MKRFRALLVSCIALVACAEEAPRQPTQARPMDEPRAQEVIGRTFQAEGIDVEAGRTLLVSSGKPVKLEVAATGHKWGVIWLTREQAHELASILPKHDNDDGALVILPGIGVDAAGRALALWETDYMTDDLSGAAHSATEITAERKLERDVRDFLQKAKTEQWP